MHLKTHFKFQFNSSKNYTTSVHVIFFLNTRLHYDPNKIRTTKFGFIKLEIQFLQNINPFWNNWASFWIHSHCHEGSTHQLGPHGSETETGEGLPRCSGELFLAGVEGSGGCVTTVAISELNCVEGCMEHDEWPLGAWTAAAMVDNDDAQRHASQLWPWYHLAKGARVT